MCIRIKALIKTFPMVGVVIKSLVHEKSLVSNNIFDEAFPLGRRTWGLGFLYPTTLMHRASVTLYLRDKPSPNPITLANVSVNHNRG